MSLAPTDPNTLETIEKHKSFGGTQGVFRHFSRLADGPMEFSVYLPPNRQPGARLPVVYYLSGLTCTQDNVTTKGGFQRHAAEHGLIVVCPDTSPRGKGYPGEDDSYDFGSGAGFYVDATQPPWHESYRMYSYVTEELPRVIAANFPADTDRSGIFGHSMGGHGALVAALRNPRQYRSVSAFAPIVAPTQVPWGQKAFHGYLGEDQETWKKYDATELIKAGHRFDAPILIDQGTADDFLREQLRPELFVQACEERGQPVNLRMQDGYDHSYYFIATFMGDHMAHHARLLKA